MPRFYFDVHGLHGLAVDEVGGEFVDAEAARRDALELLPDLLRNERLDGQARMLDVTLRDETGRVVLITSLSLSTHVPETVLPATFVPPTVLPEALESEAFVPASVMPASVMPASVMPATVMPATVMAATVTTAAVVAQTARPALQPNPADDPIRRDWSARHRGLTEACAETAMLLSTTRRLLGRISAP